MDKPRVIETAADAKRLQGDIMRLMRQYGGSGKDSWSVANHRAADQVAKANGFASTRELRKEISKHLMEHGNERKPNKRKDEKAAGLALEIIKMLDGQAGKLPQDWELAAKLGVTPYQAGAGRRMLSQLGWQVQPVTNGYVVTPPAAPEVPHEIPSNGTATQGEISLFNTGCGCDGEAILKELRQIRALLAKLKIV